MDLVLATLKFIINKKTNTRQICIFYCLLVNLSDSFHQTLFLLSFNQIIKSITSILINFKKLFRFIHYLTNMIMSSFWDGLKSFWNFKWDGLWVKRCERMEYGWKDLRIKGDGQKWLDYFQKEWFHIRVSSYQGSKVLNFQW